MTAYSFEALDRRGDLITGREEESSPAAVERTLRDRGLRPLRVEQHGGGEGGGWRGFRRRRADVGEAFRYLSTLLSAGYPLDRALDTVRRLVSRDDVSEALGEVRHQVRAGSSLADALEERDDVFPRLSVGMTRAGERSGNLGETLGRLSSHLEREERLVARLLSSLLYPAVLVVVGGIALLVLTMYVLPRFTEILADAGSAVPASTALLIGVSDFVGTWWPALMAGLAAFGWSVAAYVRTENGRRRVASVLHRLPLIGGLRRRATCARLGRSLAALLRSGLPIMEALEAAVAATADPVGADELQRARERLRTGDSLSAALTGGRAFTPLFLEMTSAGEESGRLPELLERAAAASEEELERRLETGIHLVEPALIVAFGGAVGFVALSLLEAIYGVQLRPM